MESYLTVLRHIWRSAAVLVVMIFAHAGASAQTTPTVPTPEATAPASQASPTPQAAETPKVSPTPSLERRFFRNLLDDQRAIWTSPLRLRGEDAKWLAPLGASTVGLIAADRRIAGELDDDDDFRLDVSRGVSKFGSIYTTSGVAATFYFIGRGTGNARARETGLLGLEALANSVAVYSVLKRVTQRPRPRAEGGHGRFFDEGNSFPSGHAVNAWALATVVAYEYEDRPIVRYGAYSLATAVSLSRFGGRRHFLSDVLVGSAIGFGIGRYVYRTHHDPSLDEKDRTSTPTVRSKLLPFIVPSYDRRTRSYGMTLKWSF